MITSRLFSAVSKQQAMRCVVNLSSVADIESVQRTVIPGGIKIAAAKRLGAPLVGVTVMYDAGTRYEADECIGANHFLRRLSDANTGTQTSFCKTRVLQQQGAYVTCASDRQNISYTLRCTEPVFHKYKDLFLDTATKQTAYFWDIDPRKALVRHDILTLTPQQRLLDMIQSAAWSHGLANSLYCPAGRINSMSDCALQGYVKKYFCSERCSIGTVGLDYNHVMKFAETLFPLPPLPTGKECVEEPPPDPSYFRGGFQYHDLGPGATSWFAVAVPSCGLDNYHDFIKYNIAAYACGVEPVCAGKSGFNNVGQAPLSDLAAGDTNTSFAAFNISYKNSGLFGIMGKTSSYSLCRMSLQAVRFLREIGSLGDGHIAVGKARLGLAFSRMEFDSALKSTDFALQAANNVIMDTPDAAIAYIENVTKKDITSTLDSISKSTKQLALAVVGDIGCMPNETELRDLS